VTVSAAATPERWRDVHSSDGAVSCRVRSTRRDECWQIAVATVLEVPVDDVPDWRLDERRRAGEDPKEISRLAWEEMRTWLAARGLRVVTHRKVPVARERWIGVVPMRGRFNDHSMAMSWGDILFDPSVTFELVGMAKILTAEQLAIVQKPRVRLWRPEDVRWGFSFQKVSKFARRDVKAWR
jgi:hypothetical protein